MKDTTVYLLIQVFKRFEIRQTAVYSVYRMKKYSCLSAETSFIMWFAVIKINGYTCPPALCAGTLAT